MTLTKTRSRNSMSGSCLLNGQPLPAAEERGFFEDCSLDVPDFKPYVAHQLTMKLSSTVHVTKMTYICVDCDVKQ